MKFYFKCVIVGRDNVLRDNTSGHITNTPVLAPPTVTQRGAFMPTLGEAGLAVSI